MGLAQSIAAAFFQCSRRFCRWPEPRAKPASQKNRLGLLGERLAADHLRRHGYKILYRNFRGPRGGEVDVVCRQKAGGALVFVEVKTRRSLRYGAPSSAVTLAKQRLIARGALAWLKLLGNPRIPFRFDIVEVWFENGAARFRVIEDAFQLPEPLIY
jgi:putative endonuclease